MAVLAGLSMVGCAAQQPAAEAPSATFTSTAKDPQIVQQIMADSGWLQKNRLPKRPVADAIPWLLIRAKSTQGSGLFHDVTYIQRVNTRGGLPPLAVHNEAHLGEEVRVRYTAEYFFYRTEK